MLAAGYRGEYPDVTILAGKIEKRRGRNYSHRGSYRVLGTPMSALG